MRKCYLFFNRASSLLFLSAVVNQKYTVQVHDEYVMTGNTAVLKCQVRVLSTHLFHIHKMHLTSKLNFTQLPKQNAVQICLSWLTEVPSFSLSPHFLSLAGAQLHVGIRNGHRLGAGHRHASVSEHRHRRQVHGTIERRIVHK